MKTREGVGFWVCATLVFASMVGTGVFTSLGFQVASLPSPAVILFLWTLGGVVALCGALSYAELAAALPRSGGEYHFLGRVFHPALGLMAGVVSVFVGFAAPIALGAMAFGRYASAAVPSLHPLACSFGVVLALAVIHSVALGVSGRFQVFATGFKALLIGTFLVVGLLHAPGVDFRPQPGDLGLIASAPFAVSLLFVMYSYSGWNAAVYIVGEVRDPARVVPRALLAATGLVTVLYVALNAMFLASAPMAAYAGKIEVGEIAARHVLGEGGGRLLAAVVAVGLISALSALTWAGPRVAQTAGEDFPVLGWFAVRSATGLPVRATVFQTLLVFVLLLTASFEAVLVYAQFALVACSALTVAAMVWLRWKSPELPRPFRCPMFPLVPLVFLAVAALTLGYTVATKPVQALAGVLTLAGGLGLYFVVKSR